MSQVTILAAIKSKLQGAGAKNVHDYDRWFRTEDQFSAIFQGEESQVHGWTISRIAADSQQAARATATRAHRFRIRGLYALDDSAATEKTFQTLVDAVMGAFDGDCALGLTTITGAEPIQLQTLEPRMFGRILCHYAELILDVPEDVTYTP